MVVVKAKPGESADRLIARFRKKILNSGVLLEYKERERHKTASEKRKENKYRVAHLREIQKKYPKDQ
jgi:ribosomal protein S21